MGIHDYQPRPKGSKQLTFNSVVSTVAAALIGLAILKIDNLNTSSIRQNDAIDGLSGDVKDLKNKMAQMVTHAEFNAVQALRVALGGGFV